MKSKELLSEQYKYIYINFLPNAHLVYREFINKWGIIDDRDKKLIPFKYEHIEKRKKYIVCRNVDCTYDLYDKNFNIIVEQIKNIIILKSGNISFMNKENQIGMINSKKKIIIPFEYSEAKVLHYDELNYDDYIELKKENDLNSYLFDCNAKFVGNYTIAKGDESIYILEPTNQENTPRAILFRKSHYITESKYHYEYFKHYNKIICKTVDNDYLILDENGNEENTGLNGNLSKFYSINEHEFFASIDDQQYIILLPLKIIKLKGKMKIGSQMNFFYYEGDLYAISREENCQKSQYVYGQWVEETTKYGWTTIYKILNNGTIEEMDKNKLSNLKYYLRDNNI